MPVSFDSLPAALYASPHFKLLAELCADKSACLVGGSIRDALLGRAITDLDLIFPDDPTALAKDFARRIGGHWFWLDRPRRQSRVVASGDNDELNYDFARFRAPSLEQDLYDRDFTINALALPLTAQLSAEALVDPCRGLDDLRRQRLKMVSVHSLANDPLRIVKGVRHATVLGLEVEAATLACMRSGAAGLGEVAPERIRLEVWKVLGAAQAGRGLRLLDASGAGEALFGAGFAETLPELVERLDRCRRQWRQLADSHPPVADWLAEEVEQGLSRGTLAQFALLLAVVEPALSGDLALRWRLSRKARTNLAALAALEATLLKEFAGIARSRRAFAWWAARCHADPQLLLLALAGSPDNSVPVTDLAAWAPLVADLDGSRPGDLVDGHWLRSALSLKDGPAMSNALELLRNAEISGEVCTPQEARGFLARHYQKRD